METTLERESERRYATLERRHGPVEAVISAFRYRVSWGAVFAGMFVGTAIQILLAALGTGIGASTINPGQEANPLAGIGIGAAIWLFISTIVAFYASGWVSGRMSGAVRRSEAGYHGFVTWGFSSVVTTILMTGVLGAALSGVTGVVGKAISGAANNADSLPPAITNTIESELEERGVNVDQLRSGSPDQVRDQAQNAAGQAQQAVQNPEVQQNAVEVADKAATGISVAGLLGFFLMLCAMLASVWGGASSMPRARHT